MGHQPQLYALVGGEQSCVALNIHLPKSCSALFYNSFCLSEQFEILAEMSEDKYSYRVVTKDDRQKILEYLVKYFKKEEPLNRASGMSDKKFLLIAEYIIDNCLKHPLSTVVECKETGDIAAVLLNSILLRTGEKHNIDVGDEEGPGVSTFGAWDRWSHVRNHIAG
ncbi:hypothetical protein GCK32_009022 [Trichostrongylus colubriformis]|uniref:Uncharacterized protein n=1 Tax=Trichostrongylus colubriformis TaxID=6319 RepID=A0AAN8IDV1_TRICO